MSDFSTAELAERLAAVEDDIEALHETLRRIQELMKLVENGALDGASRFDHGRRTSKVRHLSVVR